MHAWSGHRHVLAAHHTCKRTLCLCLPWRAIKVDFLMKFSLHQLSHLCLWFSWWHFASTVCLYIEMVNVSAGWNRIAILNSFAATITRLWRLVLPGVPRAVPEGLGTTLYSWQCFFASFPVANLQLLSDVFFSAPARTITWSRRRLVA